MVVTNVDVQAVYRKINEKLQFLVNKSVNHNRQQSSELEWCEKKKELAAKRKAEIVKATCLIKWPKQIEDEATVVDYLCDYRLLYKQGDFLYIEEIGEERVAKFSNKGHLISDEVKLKDCFHKDEEDDWSNEEWHGKDERVSFQYDRLKSVQYAERWWNSRNPNYPYFDVNCTNYVSQCLRAGDAPMRGYPNRSSGWWLANNNWSYSWSVAHALMLYLSTSKTGLRAEEVSSPELLKPGDVICYDFQGDGRFDHSTFVVAKDKSDMPLVNAQTSNSRMRYWSYEDSTAYTENIQYKFFHIIDDNEDS
ncbi:MULTISPECIES: amidase domain-containing protein [Aeribacillus]|jgi:hypothetical protein|uniref:Amidase domain-containing protein n=1 Tax=Aeribacillus composti TaxID=1868734 RepID=A0ABY9WGP3_9BACI|nr:MULTISPECIES: amidase domain-containing protein [Aeribacillus]MDR9796635.1 amidase domain-containing protein [Aeribacillus pallidus]MED0650362.1 amidase domain-containing protein [Aeribacillus composti]MED0702198.1 amidase domain-containing protein [Aeribacillus composti]MED1438335.1 amidase domain-containing protein [Aeribacillus composti]MED1442063.1 amidase domain-containing protein [Aeribacillus composti]